MEKLHKLTRRDILRMECDLFNDIAPILDCEGCSLYFPTSNEPAEALYLENEEKLLLPLKFMDSEELLAVFLARKPNKEKLKQALSTLPTIIHLILEKLSLKKEIQFDSTTELYSQHVLLDRLSDKIEKMRKSFTEFSEFSQNNLLTHGCVGVLYLHFADLPNLAKKYGYLFAENCMHELTQHILDILPEDSLLARINNYDCALFLDEEVLESKADLNDFIYNLCQSTSSVTFSAPPRRTNKILRVSCPLHCGYVLFPQDYDTMISDRNEKELAHNLISKAHYSAIRAKEQEKVFLPFNLLISEGGNISKILPHNQFIINLGRNVGLRESTRFSVYASENNSNDSYSDTPKYKGEIQLVEIFDEYSRAEQVILYDPAFPIQSNDSLVKLPDDFGASAQSQSQPAKNNFTQLYKYQDFLTLFAELKVTHPQFTLTLINIEESKTNNIPIENIFAETVQIFNKEIRMQYNFNNDNCILAQYGHNSILGFLPLTQAFNIYETLKAYKALSMILNGHIKQKVSIGIAEYPLLNYRQTDTLDNAKKAVDCAKLLDFPHVGTCDSISLTVSADKLVTQGLLYEALQEYQSALIADPKNTLAQSSLGVTLVSLGRYSEAQSAFYAALELSPDDVAVHYNLGGVCQKLNDINEAKKYYSYCLKSDDYTYFAHIKLGQIAEEENSTMQAVEHYKKALEKDSRQATPYRQLAKIALNENNSSQAREYLHTALRNAPQDSGSLLLLAKLYLENNEDPALAAMLLSPIMTQRQNNVEAWKIYAKALRAQGKIEEASRAELTIKNLQA